MGVKWLVGMAMLYVVLSVVDGIAGGTFFGTTGVGRIWVVFTSVQAIDVTNPIAVASGILMSLWQILVAIFEILTWNFPHIFVGVWAIVRWVLVAISMGIIVSLLLALRGVSSG